MAAALDPRSFRTAGVRPSLPGTTAGRPALTLIEGGRSDSARRLRRVYLQRRLVAALTILVLGWVLLSLVGTANAALFSSDAGATSASASGRAASKSPVPSSAAAGGGAAASRYVVGPGDTLWSVARSLHLGGDLRDVVDALAERNGDGMLRPGQVLVIPDDLRS